MPPNESLDARISAILDDPASSWELRSMLHASLARDPWDALADAKVLVGILYRRIEEMEGAPPPDPDSDLVRALTEALKRAPLQPRPFEHR